MSSSVEESTDLCSSSDENLGEALTLFLVGMIQPGARTNRRLNIPEESLNEDLTSASHIIPDNCERWFRC